MDDLAFLRARIESYADYTNDEIARRLTDEQVRAYVGEALSEAAERFGPPLAHDARLDETLLRCEFADQHVIHALDAGAFGPSEIATFYHRDRALVELADRAASVAATDVPAYLEDVNAALDARARTIGALLPPARRPPH